jgi:hypothetical protein
MRGLESVSSVSASCGSKADLVLGRDEHFARPTDAARRTLVELRAVAGQDAVLVSKKLF